jgi:hypothetical protein
MQQDAEPDSWGGELDVRITCNVRRALPAYVMFHNILPGSKPE